MSAGVRTCTAYSSNRAIGFYPPNSSEARVLLAEQDLGPADLERAFARLETTEDTPVGTIIGINEDGVFGTGQEGWRPDLPDACHEPLIPLLWVKVHELLGRVPKGSTAQFIKDGTLPGEAKCGATGYRMASYGGSLLVWFPGSATPW